MWDEIINRVRYNIRTTGLLIVTWRIEHRESFPLPRWSSWGGEKPRVKRFFLPHILSWYSVLSTPPSSLDMVREKECFLLTLTHFLKLIDLTHICLTFNDFLFTCTNQSWHLHTLFFVSVRPGATQSDVWGLATYQSNGWVGRRYLRPRRPPQRGSSTRSCNWLH